MGKSTTGLGQWRGKVGSVVFRKGDAGETIVSAYQPEVRNPRSEGQLEQRAKVNLAGKISQAVIPGLISSLGTSGRGRRGAFLSNLINSVVVTKNNDVYSAQIAYEKVKFSKGPSAPWDITNSSTGTDVMLSWADRSGYGINDSGQAKVTVILLISSDDKEMTPIVYFDTVNYEDRQFSVSLPATIAQSGYHAAVWLVASEPDAAVSNLGMGGVLMTATEFNALLQQNSALTGLKFYDTEFAFTVNFS